MDSLAENGSRWFCAAAHNVGTASFEMQACGDSGNRYWIGVFTVVAALMIAIIALWRFGFGERSAG